MRAIWVDVADGTAELGSRIAQKVAAAGWPLPLCATAARDYGLRSLRASAAADNAGSRAVLSLVGFVPTNEEDLLACRDEHRYLLSLAGLMPPKER